MDLGLQRVAGHRRIDAIDQEAHRPLQERILDALQALLEGQHAVAAGHAGQLDQLGDQTGQVDLLVLEGHAEHLQAPDEVRHGEGDGDRAHGPADHDDRGGQLQQRAGVTTFQGLTHQDAGDGE